MLILTRRRGESLKVGDDVTITILGVDRHQVRVGINAPKEVAIHREEIYERIQTTRLLGTEACMHLPDKAGGLK